MSRNKKILWSLFVMSGVAAFVGLFLAFDNRAAANPSTISPSSQTKYSTTNASSTPTFMTAGTATSTLTLDQINKVSTTSLVMKPLSDAAGLVGVDQAYLALQITGSSSANSLVDIKWEYSNDGIDFYRDNATSTRIAYASTTPSGQSFGETPKHRQTGNVTNNVLIAVPAVPARYVRAVITVPIGSLNSTNWAQFITREQR